MRHLKRGRHLNRNATHRRALMKNLAAALFEHERIITTVAKAKELRPFAERLITLAKRNSLHARRLCISRLGNKDMVAKLFKDIAPRFSDRPGGYTRIIKRPQVRLGDAGPTAFIELLKAGETKAKPSKPVAPQVTSTD
jgi:large subunit ribosomal protein L17